MQTIRFEKEVPVIAKYHTVVCGGGAAGWAAAVASARQGKKTALIEKFSFVGGTATAGLVVPLSGCYHKEKRVVGGVCWEFVKEMEKLGAAQIELPKGHISFDPEVYKLVAQRMLRDAGVHLYTNAYLSGHKQDEKRITHVLIESKNGTEAIEGEVFIDATGDADLCHMAGVEMLPVEKELQPMSLCFVLGNVDVSTDLLKNHIHHDGKNCKQSAHAGIHAYLDEIAGKEYVPQFGGPWFNTTMGDDLVAVNITRTAGNGADRETLTQSEAKLREAAFRIVELLRKKYPEFSRCTVVSTAIQMGIRETRRIRGLYTACGEEMLRNTVYPDSVACCAHPMDIHSATDNTQTLMHLPVPGHIPYRAMIPHEFDNLLAAGRCIAADRASYASIRVQATVMALGEAAGIAAAMCSANTPARDVSIELLHEKLRKANAIFLAADAR
ncbi:MAG: FAD-dependent oxidoreductase [Clostridia bacterium]|nr:FAD-dependent oxidoreductase [Clostridia bacterium]